MHTILIVDDEPAIRDLLGFALRLGGFQVQQAANGQKALALCQANPAQIGLVLLAIRMPGMGGLRTFAALQQLEPAPPCCFLSGTISRSTKAALLKLGALHVFQKPVFSILDFVQRVRLLMTMLPATPT
jgi:DNA-binding response OmpR family regulator